MKVTYNQILSKFETFATNHRQINEYADGSLFDVASHDQLTDYNYPLLFVDTTASASLGEGTITNSFNVMVMDKANDNTVENEVKSDTLLILLDVIAYFEKLYTGDWKFVVIEKSGSANPFTERFVDTLTGWEVGINLKQAVQYDECQIPD